MHRFKTSLFALMAFALALPLLGGCVERDVVYVRAAPPRRVVVVEGRPGYVWVPGHWVHRPGAAVWIEGHWRRI